MVKYKAMMENLNENIRYQFKIILLGEGGVGKTCITNRFCYSEFLDTKLTIGLSFNSYSILAEENGEKIRIGLSIWDFGGQERFRPLLPQFISGANGVIWVYDMTAFHSLIRLEEKWLPLLRANSDNIPSILVGAKYDIINENKKIDPTIVEDIRKKLGASSAFETSSKTGYNTSLIFKELVKLLLSKPPYIKRNIKLL
ncbi:MAG: GTP-binding protein [Candidatus Lokiarchaeota archaeon]|nr:GTP-binding protein [Candidatus Harpocratesius repetitus]